MRPHRLELTAIGSYGGDVVVDFDALAPWGLFHIHGPTGAGKSSLLDGLCFALYGKVPPPRTADHLRSHHAEPKTEAKATLDFSLQGTDYRIVRTPTQWRAKKSGTGLTEQRATATLHRRSGLALEPITSAIKEVDAMVEELIGLDAIQFMQVVVLPQGGFQRALRANANERSELLSSLFHAERFGTYGDRLKERAAALTKALEHKSEQMRSVILRVSQRAADEGLAVEWPGIDIVDERSINALAEATYIAKSRVALLDTELADAEGRRTETTLALNVGAQTHERQVRRRRAEEQMSIVVARASETASAKAALQAASEVRALVPVVETFQHFEQQLRTADRSLETAGTSVTRLIHAARRHATGLTADDPRQVLAALATGADLQVAYTAASSQLQLRGAQVVKANAELVAADIATQKASAAMEGLRSERLALAQSEAERQVAADKLVLIQAQADASARAKAVSAQCAIAAEDVTAAQARAQEFQVHHLELWERRLRGMAAELSTKLIEGEDCMVCGSISHPSPALPTADAVTEHDVESARQEAAKSAQVVRELETALNAKRLELQALIQEAGPAASDPEEHGRTRTNALRALAAAESACERLQIVDTELDRLHTQQSLLAERSSEALVRSAENQALLDEAQVRCDELSMKLSDLLGADANVVEATAVAKQLRDALDSQVRASIEWQSTSMHHRNASEQLDIALAASDFETVEDVLSKHIDSSEADSLARLVEELSQMSVTAQAALEETADVNGLPAIDLTELQSATTEMSARYDSLVRQHTGAVAMAEDFSASLATVTKAYEALEPLATETERVRQLADLCASGKNEKRMSLKNFVLAAYLEEVAVAASTRLKLMSSGRYELRHSDKLAKGGASSGLSLTVSDAYTGQEREVNSLSGGETFMASLALALGLADVVQSHAGGIHVECLFIDEGFGSLDADTLELAMAELDRLREGGRLVGVISHVPTLRERIPAGIEVVPGANGSTIRMRSQTALIA